MNTKKELKSGAFLEIQMSSHENCMDFITCLANELKKVDLKLDDLKEGFNTEISDIFNPIKNLFLNLLTSKDIKNCLEKLFSKCLYNDKKINNDLFDNDIKARGDYFIICWEVARYNLSPFLPKNINLDFASFLKEWMTKTNISIQK
jgi:hypothetical protein